MSADAIPGLIFLSPFFLIMVVWVVWMILFLEGDDIHRRRQARRAQKMAHVERMAELRAREAEARKSQKYHPLWVHERRPAKEE